MQCNIHALPHLTGLFLLVVDCFGDTGRMRGTQLRVQMLSPHPPNVASYLSPYHKLTISILAVLVLVVFGFGNDVFLFLFLPGILPIGKIICKET